MQRVSASIHGIFMTMTVIFLMILTFSAGVSCAATDADKAPLINLQNNNESLYTPFDTSSQLQHPNTEEGQDSCLKRLTSYFADTKKKYICAFVATATVIAIGITLWRLLSHYTNNDNHGALPPTTEMFWPIEAELSNSTKALLTKISKDQMFFSLLTLLWSNASDGFNATNCSTSSPAFWQIMLQAKKIMNTDIDGIELRDSLRHRGMIVCDILPVSQGRPGLFSCDHNPTFSAANFTHIQPGDICPTNYGVLKADGAVRLFFYNTLREIDNLFVFNHETNMIGYKNSFNPAWKTETRLRSSSKSLTETGSFSFTSDKTQSFSKQQTSSKSVSLSGDKSLSKSASHIASLTFSNSDTLSLPLLEWFANIPINEPVSTLYLWELVTANGAPGSPPPRCGHSMNAIGDALYIFGGEYPCSTTRTGDNYDDIWKFDGSVWSKITPFSGRTPLPRAWASSSVFGAYFYIFAGGTWGTQSLPPSFFNDLWRFNIALNNWEQLTINGDPSNPPGRGGAAANVIGNYFYIFGGGGKTTGLNDFWQFDSAWLDITPPVSPPKRWGCMMMPIDKNSYLFGGWLDFPANSPSNDLWKYDGSNWMLVTPDTDLLISPMKRQWYSMGTIKQVLLIFGGDIGTTYGVMDNLNDLWSFDTIAQAWTQLIPNGQIKSPDSRMYSANLCNINDDAYLFGGFGVSGTLNDLWRLHQISIRLFGLHVASNPVYFDTPFNFSWQVNTTGGSDYHIATIDFNGTKSYTAKYWNRLASIILTAPNISSDFWINLKVQDDLYPAASANETIKFVLNNCIFYAEYLAQNSIARNLLNEVPCSSTRLNLASKNIGDADIIAITPAIRCLTNLQSLDLINNNIGNIGASSLSSILQYLTNLQNIAMDNNNIGDSGVALLIPALQQLVNNSFLRVIGMYNDPMSSEVCANLRAVLSRAAVACGPS